MTHLHTPTPLARRYALPRRNWRDFASDPPRLGTAVRIWFPEWNLFWADCPHVPALDCSFDACHRPVAVETDGAARFMLIPDDPVRTGARVQRGDIVHLRRIDGPMAGRDLGRASDPLDPGLTLAQRDPRRRDDFLWRVTAAPGRCRLASRAMGLESLSDPGAGVVPYKGFLELSRNPAESTSVILLPG